MKHEHLQFFLPFYPSLITTIKYGGVYGLHRSVLRMIWLVDYLNPHSNTSDCLVIEAECRDSAYNQAVEELKILNIPKRNILNMEEF